MILYYLTGLEFAYNDLLNHHIKIATLDSVNDPYEWLPCMLNESNVPYSAEKTRQWMCNRYKDKYGFLCLSSDISNPALWGYYGNNHRGAAFGFEFEEDELPIKMVYDNTRIIYSEETMTKGGAEMMKCFQNIIRRKAKTWSHEKEYRLIVDLERNCVQISGLWFGKFLECRLKEIVLGCRCSDHNLACMKNLLNIKGLSNVLVRRTVLDETSFLMKLNVSSPFKIGSFLWACTGGSLFEEKE